ncbi:MAG: nickel-type superoxide dismutase maturation protease [Candidatus Limnocylindria bacterium]
MFRRVAVAGRSMEPALRAGDWLIIVGFSRPPGVGEIVLARDPRDPERLVVKRVAAVKDGAFTLLGDRPQHSTDSRTFGPVQLGDVLGRAVFRYGPVGRIGWLW